MAKSLAKYNGFSASTLKTRADVPAQADIVVSGDNILCSNMQVSQIKGVLNSAYTDVWNLCNEDKVNIWSEFGPTEWSISGTTLVNSVIDPFALGSFAGYNHNATQPYWVAKTTNANVYNYPDTFTLTAYFHPGELNYSGIDGNISKVVLKIYDDTTPLYTGTTTLESSFADSTILMNATIGYPYETSKNLTAKLYLGNTAEELIAYMPLSGSTGWNVAVTSYYNVVITHTFTIRNNWPETPIITKISPDTYITRTSTEYAMVYDLSRVTPNDFTSALHISLYVTLSRDLGSGYEIIASGVANSDVTTTGVSDPQRFYQSANLSDISGFPESLNWGDQLSFYMDRVSGGF